MSIRHLCRALAVALALSGTALAAGPTKDQDKRIAGLIETSVKAQKADDPVKAYLYLREAIRLEQLWSGNTAADDTPASQQLARFTAELLHKEDGKLLKLLHSKLVPTSDKLNLLRLLEDDMIMNYPGRHGDELLGGFDE
jgi:hypothetical protein